MMHHILSPLLRLTLLTTCCLELRYFLGDFEGGISRICYPRRALTSPVAMGTARRDENNVNKLAPDPIMLSIMHMSPASISCETPAESPLLAFRPLAPLTP